MLKSKIVKIVLAVISSVLISSFYNINKTVADMAVKESLYSIKINDLNGEKIDLNKFKGKKILIVNTASKCGFTGQYEGLQELHKVYGEKLVVIGVPCNQFRSQEPGTADEIGLFCKVNYGVTFLLTEKIFVKGDKKHPLYEWLTNKELNEIKSSSVKWNFQKYLIDEDGRLIDYFYSITKPMSAKITRYLN